MNDWIHVDKDPLHVAREKRKAAELKKSQWWKNKLAEGLCHYCGRKFKPAELTLDHVVPIARGGTSTRSNVVASCRECNRAKSVMTPVDMILDQIKKG